MNKCMCCLKEIKDTENEKGLLTFTQEEEWEKFLHIACLMKLIEYLIDQMKEN